MLRKFTAAALLAVVVNAEEAVVSPDGSVEPAAATEEAAPEEIPATPAAEEAAPAATEGEEAAPAATEGEGEAASAEEKKDDGLGPDTPDDDLSEFDPSPEVDLENKMNTLLSLLENKNVDPKTKEQLQTLMGQLKGLGMDSGGLMDALGGDKKENKKNQVTAEKLMTACSILSAQYNGATRSSTLTQLRAIGEADSLAKLIEGGKASDMLPLIVGCAEELTQEELKKFNRNKLKKIPQHVIDASAEYASNSTKLAEFDADLFTTLQKRMEVVVETLEQSAATKKISTPLPSFVNMGLIAAFFSAFALLVMKFFAMQRSIGAEKPAEKQQSAKSLKAEQKAAAALAKKRGA
jgi:hypothetical protein